MIADMLASGDWAEITAERRSAPHGPIHLQYKCWTNPTGRSPAIGCLGRLCGVVDGNGGGAEKTSPNTSSAAQPRSTGVACGRRVESCRVTPAKERKRKPSYNHGAPAWQVGFGSARTSYAPNRRQAGGSDDSLGAGTGELRRLVCTRCGLPPAGHMNQSSKQQQSESCRMWPASFSAVHVEGHQADVDLRHPRRTEATATPLSTVAHEIESAYRDLAAS